LQIFYEIRGRGHSYKLLNPIVWSSTLHAVHYKDMEVQGGSTSKSLPNYKKILLKSASKIKFLRQI